MPAAHFPSVTIPPLSISTLVGFEEYMLSCSNVAGETIRGICFSRDIEYSVLNSNTKYSVSHFVPTHVLSSVLKRILMKNISCSGLTL